MSVEGTGELYPGYSIAIALQVHYKVTKRAPIYHLNIPEILR